MDLRLGNPPKPPARLMAPVLLDKHVGRESAMSSVVGYDRHPASRAAVLLTGDPVKALLKTADDCAARLIVVGRPQHGIGPVLNHIVTGTATRNLLRHSTRPVAVVPELADSP